MPALICRACGTIVASVLANHESGRPLVVAAPSAGPPQVPRAGNLRPLPIENEVLALREFDLHIHTVEQQPEEVIQSARALFQRAYDSQAFRTRVLF